MTHCGCWSQERGRRLGQRGAVGEPFATKTGGPAIPFLFDFAELFPKAEILVTGVDDPQSGPHGPDEGLHLGEFERVCLAETLFLSKLAS